MVEAPVLNESIIVFPVLCGVNVPDQEPPAASNKVGDHKSDYNESENPVDKHGRVLRLQPVSSRRILIVALDDSIKSADVENGDQFWQPCEPDQPRVEHVLVQGQIEGESRNEVYDHPATFEVSAGDAFVVTHLLVSVFVDVFGHHVEYKVQEEDRCNSIIDLSYGRRVLSIESHIVDSCEAGISND